MSLVSGPKKNHKKGIAAMYKAEKRKQAETRHAAYQKLPLAEKIARNSTKVRAKLREQSNG